MSLARASSSLPRLRVASSPFFRRRNVATANHSHEEHHDSSNYPKEGSSPLYSWVLFSELIFDLGFNNALWRNTVLFSLLAAGFYKYAPEPSDDVYLTRWIAMYTAPRDLWLELNAKHTAQQQEVSDTAMLITDAKKPRVHRYRYPQWVVSGCRMWTTLLTGTNLGPLNRHRPS